MGQSWIVVAIIVCVGLAIVLFFRERRAAAPPGKTSKDAGAKPGTSGAAAGKRTDGDAKAGKSSSSAAAGGKAGAKAKGVPSVARSHGEEEDDDITIVTLTPRLDLLAAAEGRLPDASDREDEDPHAELDSERASAVPIIYDEDAAEDEPTRSHAVILVGAVGQTDRGQKRKINEDRYLALEDHHLYVVADGMGGHAGGEVASQCAVDVIEQAFKTQHFEGDPYENVPRRGSELALAIQMANKAIHEKARLDAQLAGMGTTIVSARFTPGKQRLYIGHVGDSRCYRFRAGQLTQITTDHTMGSIGMTGPFADHLSRAVGIAPAVKVDLVIAKPRHEDVYLLCSDGLSKMVKDDSICEVLKANPDPNDAAKVLVERANEGGGRDNITVILVMVKDPKGFARYMVEHSRKKKATEADGVDVATVEATAAETAAVEAAADEAAAASIAGAKLAGTKPRLKGADEITPVVAISAAASAKGSEEITPVVAITVDAAANDTPTERMAPLAEQMANNPQMATSGPASKKAQRPAKKK